MKKIAFVVVEDGMFFSPSLLSACFISHALSTLSGGGFGHVFIFVQSEESWKVKDVISRKYLNFLRPELNNRVRVCSNKDKYAIEFLEFLIELSEKQISLRIFAKPGVRQLILEKVDAYSSDLNKRGIFRIPLIFTT